MHAEAPIDREQLAVLRALEPSSLAVEELAAVLGRDARQVAAATARLERVGLVRCLGDEPCRFAPTSAGFDLIIESSTALEPRPAEPATITPYRDGPLVVRGAFRLVDQDGREIDTQRSTIALCRCGKSKIRPLCDGTHKQVDFRAPSAAEDRSRPERSV